MKNKNQSGTGLNYNAQITVDKNGIILGDNIVQEVDDRNQLVANVNMIEGDYGKLTEGTIVSADAGYEKAKDLKELDERGFDLYVPGKNVYGSKDKKFAKANFTYNEDEDCYICPAEKKLVNSGKYFNKKRGEHLKIYKTNCNDCSNCSYKDECCKNAKQRAIHALPEDKLLNQIKKKLRTKEGKEIFGLRKQTVETSIGDLKQNKNFRSFSLRGVEKVRTEFKIACTAHNFVRINNMLYKPPG